MASCNKTTLYRLAKDSKVIGSLIAAARNGKQVTVVIELLARFDEESNIDWSRKMAEAGINVITGVEGLKIHSKITLICCKGSDIACLSSGNFHEGNARAYTDLMLMTARKPIVNDVGRVFQFIEKLLIASANANQVNTAYLYVDVGGGSTEVSCIANGELRKSCSFNIGTLRMLSGTASLDFINEMCDQICEMIDGLTEVSIIGSGGNINKLYRLVPKKTKSKDRITLQQLEKLYGQLSSISLEERIREFDLRPDRADVIVPAAQIFIAIARAVNSNAILVPTIGLADGIINKLANNNSEL